ncbi:Uncharacterised protein [Vibrio cholerae]|nr:Uncharacterised protein [Vibrio cholerae]
MNLIHATKHDGDSHHKHYNDQRKTGIHTPNNGTLHNFSPSKITHCY